MSQCRSLIAMTVLFVMTTANPLALSTSEGSSTTNTSSMLTWEVGQGGDFGCVRPGCFTPLDPDIAYTTPLESILSNVYEPLLWYNGSSSTQVIPWLASGFAVSNGGTEINFTLRSGITFADGQPLNSTDVYFSLYRLLIEDGNSPYGNGNGPSWTIQQLLNTSLSTYFGGAQSYSSTWVDKVLAQNFVSIEGPLTFSLHVLHPTASLPYLLSEPWTAIVEPSYVMSHDLALWSASNSTYRQQNLLTYPTLSGTLYNRMVEYFKDEAATCNAGSTPYGCAYTYLDTSTGGSLAGTGPYIVKSVSVNRSVTLEARNGYWGGPYQFLGGRKISPTIRTVFVRNVPLQSDRTRDLTAAASEGVPMMVDLDTTIDSTRLFDVVNQTDWVDGNKLVPIIPNVTVEGPFTGFVTYAFRFVSNVTMPSGGNGSAFLAFQPFADNRFRLAFADSVDLYAIDGQFDNLGQVATSATPPGLPPYGAYNSSNLPRYNYDPKMVQTLLLSAMSSPITKFRFFNGTKAPPGLFNDTFGCARLDSDNRCDTPVTRTITLTLEQGSPLNLAIMNQMASTVNNVSQTYNMGLRVYVQTVQTSSCAGNPHTCYFFPSGWIWEYPWVGDFTTPFYSTSLSIGFMPSDGWNMTSFSGLWAEFERADSTGNYTGVVASNDRLNALANKITLYLWTYYPYTFVVHTSNLLGLKYNPSLYGQPFMTLSIETETSPTPIYGSVVAAALVLAVSLTLAGLYVARRKGSGSETSAGIRLQEQVSSKGATSGGGEGTMAGSTATGLSLEFDGPHTGKAFDYLVSSFVDDYMRKRLYLEQAGWRSLNQISQECQIHQGLLYGRGGRQGPVVAELLRRGLVEARTFTGQRGRGGEVIKVRVAYDREPVKKFVDEAAMKP